MTKQDLRIIFLGTPDFAVATLNALVTNNFNVVAVVTAADKPAGRGQQINESAVKQYAIKNNIPVLQPEKLKNEEFINTLKSYNANIQIVVAFRMLPEIVWNMPQYGTINLHASLLPKYRGAAPINWAVINGDTETGITTFKLTHQIDTGNILMQEKIAIHSNMSTGALHDVMMQQGAQLMILTINGILNNTIKEKPQITTEASHAPKLIKETGKINWNTNAQNIHNLVRGLSPYPTAFTEIKKENENSIAIKIFETEILNINVDPTIKTGTIITDNKTFLHIKTSTDLIAIKELQLAGKKKMIIADLLRGFNFNGYTINYTADLND